MKNIELAENFVKLAKEILSAKTEYQKFFQKKLKEKGIKSPFSLEEGERKKFFKEVSTEWKKEKSASEVIAVDIDEEIKEKFKKVAKTLIALEKLEREMKEYQKEIKQSSPLLLKILEETKDKFYVVDNKFKVKILEKLGRTSTSYKSVVDESIEKLNSDAIQIIQALVKLHTKLPELKKELAIEEVKTAGLVDWFKKIMDKIKNYFKSINESYKKLEQLSNQLTASDDKPDSEDYAITDTYRGYSVSIIDGKHIGDYVEWDDAVKAVERDMKKNQFYPNVWHFNDHGNFDLVEDIKVAAVGMLKVGDYVKIDDDIDIGYGHNLYGLTGKVIKNAGGGDYIVEVETEEHPELETVTFKINREKLSKA